MAMKFVLFVFSIITSRVTSSGLLPYPIVRYSPFFSFPRTVVPGPTVIAKAAPAYVPSPFLPAPAPVFPAPAPVFPAPTPLFHAPPPVFPAPAPVFPPSAPVFSAPAPLYPAPAPVFPAPAPLIPAASAFSPALAPAIAYARSIPFAVPPYANSVHVLNKFIGAPPPTPLVRGW